jgi:hypothetical protein
MLLYCENITSRVQWIITILLGKEAVVTSGRDEFISYPHSKINYSNNRIVETEFFIQPCGLLFQQNIQQQNIQCFDWNGLPVFFKTGGDIPFDIFSAAFYLLSRYEEYLPHDKDEYGRYAHQNSIAYQNNFLHLPLVNLWMKKWRERFHFPVHHSSFTFIPTYDIDIAYAYLHQPVWKNVFGFYRDLLKADFDKVAERGNVYSGRAKDPFDVFDWLNNLHVRLNVQPVYFLLTIIERGKYDKNLTVKSKALQKLYQRLGKENETGIHPSWRSGEKDGLLQQEINVLQNVLQKPIEKSRQHYLRFTIPQTFRQLIVAGIKEEYSMGYGTINGFRASYCMPYFWYDLEKEQSTSLRLHPFCFMDANAFFEEKKSPNQAFDTLQSMFNMVRSVNGEFVCLFHNHFLTQQPQWVEWKNGYENFLLNNC